LPEDDLLNLAIEAKQTTLSVEKQKEIASVVLDNVLNDKNDQAKILEREYKVISLTTA
jgi:hypothetical protein